MALVPSGRFRIMEKQVFAQGLNWNPGTPDPQIAQAGEPPRDQIQQEEMQAPQTANPAQKADPSMAKGESITPAGQTPGPAGQQPKEQAPLTETGRKPINTTKMKQHYFSVMESINANVRQLDPKIQKQMFQRGGSADGGVEGYFIIPSYMNNGTKFVEDDEAIQIAAKVAKPFGATIDPKWSETEGGYKFIWHNRGEQIQGVTGTSFDELGGGQAAGKGKLGKAASAGFTIGELLRQRREDLYDTMRKIAKGVK